MTGRVEEVEEVGLSFAFWGVDHAVEVRGRERQQQQQHNVGQSGREEQGSGQAEESANLSTHDTLIARTVIPRSRSTLRVSRTCLLRSPFLAEGMVPVSSRSLSARVDLPWSTYC